MNAYAINYSCKVSKHPQHPVKFGDQTDNQYCLGQFAGYRVQNFSQIRNQMELPDDNAIHNICSPDNAFVAAADCNPLFTIKSDDHRNQQEPNDT